MSVDMILSGRTRSTKDHVREEDGWRRGEAFPCQLA